MQKKEDALKGVELFVLDMDGTVYLGDQLIEGALDFIREVDASEDRDFIFFKSFGLVTTTSSPSCLISISVGSAFSSVPFGPFTVTTLSLMVTVTPAGT